jgi:hypothetical protein
MMLCLSTVFIVLFVGGLRCGNQLSPPFQRIPGGKLQKKFAAPMTRPVKNPVTFGQEFFGKR